VKEIELTATHTMLHGSPQAAGTVLVEMKTLDVSLLMPPGDCEKQTDDEVKANIGAVAATTGKVTLMDLVESTGDCQATATATATANSKATKDHFHVNLAFKATVSEDEYTAAVKAVTDLKAQGNFKVTLAANGTANTVTMDKTASTRAVKQTPECGWVVSSIQWKDSLAHLHVRCTPHRAHVEMSGRNRIGCRSWIIERLLSSGHNRTGHEARCQGHRPKPHGPEGIRHDHDRRARGFACRRRGRRQRRLARSSGTGSYTPTGAMSTLPGSLIGNGQLHTMTGPRLGLGLKPVLVDFLLRPTARRWTPARGGAVGCPAHMND